MDLRMVAPSLVTVTWLPWPIDMRILSMPLGPRVDLTRSEMAMAPTNDARRACSPFSSVAPCWRTEGPPLPIIDMVRGGAEGVGWGAGVCVLVSSLLLEARVCCMDLCGWEVRVHGSGLRAFEFRVHGRGLGFGAWGLCFVV